jgi:hypothetical protein
MKDENSVPTAQKMTDVSLSIFRLKQKTRIQMIDDSERWLLPNGEGFANFLADMGPRPQGMTLDRINPQGHYEPTNWATAKVQRENQSRVIWQHAEPPPVEAADEMEARIEEYEGTSAY